MVAQWKRKTQKVNGELNDTKLLLEEQTSRNVLLEKKQRKFDAEIGLLQEDRKQESNQREKLQREVDALKAQKYGLDEQIHVSSTTQFIRNKKGCLPGVLTYFRVYRFVPNNFKSFSFSYFAPVCTMYCLREMIKEIDFIFKRP